MTYISIRLCLCCFCILNYDVCQRSDSCYLFLVSNIALNLARFAIIYSYLVSLIVAVKLEHYPLMIIILKKHRYFIFLQFYCIKISEKCAEWRTSNEDFHGRTNDTINMLHLLTWCVHPKCSFPRAFTYREQFLAE